MAYNAEKPFGQRYTTADYNFFLAMSDKVSLPRTAADEELTSFVLREAYTEIAREEEERNNRLRQEIFFNYGIQVKSTTENRPEKLFLLENSPITFAVVQDKERTRISFQTDPKLRYDPFFIYDLFFAKIPKALFGEGEDSPSGSHIKELTRVVVVDKGKKETEFNLQIPSGKESFEKVMIKPEKVNSVALFCAGRGVSYSLLLPNPVNTTDKYTQLSLPPQIPVTAETLDLLIGIHRDGSKLKKEDKNYAKSFADAINHIREELRIK